MVAQISKSPSSFMFGLNAPRLKQRESVTNTGPLQNMLWDRGWQAGPCSSHEWVSLWVTVWIVLCWNNNWSGVEPNYRLLLSLLRPISMGKWAFLSRHWCGWFSLVDGFGCRLMAKRGCSQAIEDQSSFWVWNWDHHWYSYHLGMGLHSANIPPRPWAPLGFWNLLPESQGFHNETFVCGWIQNSCCC